MTHMDIYNQERLETGEFIKIGAPKLGSIKQS